MYYCTRCHWLNKSTTCVNCHTENLAHVKQGDYCFLVEKNVLFAEALKEILDNYEIPYLCESVQGAAMALRVAPLREDFCFYVPYEYFEQAKNIIDTKFSESESLCEY